MDEALRATLTDPAKFDRLSARLGASTPDAKDKLRQRIESEKARIHEYSARISLTPHPWGPGRVDALTMIVDRTTGTLTGITQNWSAGIAPVKPPFLWNTPQGLWAQWSAFAQDPIARNFGETMGVFLPVDLTSKSPAEGLFRLSINQACGTNLDRVLRERRQRAGKSGGIEDQVALGGLLADLREFGDADRIYKQALRNYSDVSPFPVAWVYFQLGVLWGELVPKPQVTCAAEWYEKALERLPSYTKARVHLAEIYLSCGRADNAESVLIPALSSGDPEVHWRLADIMTVQGKDADAQMQAARSGFESVLERHSLAFADHGAEFYAGSGNDCRRAFELALVNVANRPTLRAFEQAHEMAVAAGDTKAAASLLGKAIQHWGDTAGFKSSPLAACCLATQEGAAA